MVSNIAIENGGQPSVTDRSIIQDESTEADTLDDLFEKYQKEIEYDTGLVNREFEEEDFEQQQLKGVLQ